LAGADAYNDITPEQELAPEHYPTVQQYRVALRAAGVSEPVIQESTVNDLQGIARVAGVDVMGVATSPVTSVNARIGDVILTAGDVGAAPTSHTHPISGVVGLTEALQELDSAINGNDYASFSMLSTLGSGIFVDRSAGTTDAARIKAAIESAITFGIGHVRFAPRPYDVRETVVIPPCSGLVLDGVPGRTVLKNFGTGEYSRLFHIAPPVGETVENVRFRGLTFDGGITNLEQLGTQRARQIGGSPAAGSPTITWGPRFNTAILAQGDLALQENSSSPDPLPPVNGVVRDIRVESCAFIGTFSLPVFFQGVRGKTLVEGSSFLRCLDPGFVYCENAEFSRNVSYYSADNGVSLSRGCVVAKAINNEFYSPWFNGVWVAGFDATGTMPNAPSYRMKGAPGPKKVLVEHNYIEGPGEHGVNAVDQSGYVQINNNEISAVRPTSPTDQDSGVGIVALAFPGQVGITLQIVGNTIEGCSRGGVLARGFRIIQINSNILRNVSTRYFQNGTTERSSLANSAQSQQFGISSGTESAMDTLTVLEIVGNIIANYEATQAFANYPIWYPGADSRRKIKDNLAHAYPQALIETP